MEITLPYQNVEELSTYGKRTVPKSIRVDTNEAENVRTIEYCLNCERIQSGLNYEVSVFFR